MACTKQYLNLAGAGLCAVGGAVGVYASVAAILGTAGAAAPGAVATAIASGIATVGSLLWAASGYMDLADCLEAAGHQADAAAMRTRSTALRGDAEALRAQLDRLQALVA